MTYSLGHWHDTHHEDNIVTQIHINNIAEEKDPRYQLLTQLAAEHQAYHHQRKQGAKHLEEFSAVLQNWATIFAPLKPLWSYPADETGHMEIH